MAKLMIYYLLKKMKNDNYQMTLKKDVFKTSKIVSVLIQHDFDGSGTILVDSEGNQYNYFGN